MFEGIQRGLSEALKKLRGRGRLTESNVRDGLREVRRALLEADVNFTVANDFINRVTERSVGQEVLRTLDPSEQIVGIVYEELVNLMGPVDHSFHFAKDRPTIVMLCGLQGSGKTTTAGKLALTLQERGRKPLLVAAPNIISVKPLPRNGGIGYSRFRSPSKILPRRSSVPLIFPAFPETPISRSTRS